MDFEKFNWFFFSKITHQLDRRAATTKTKICIIFMHKLRPFQINIHCDTVANHEIVVELLS